jgi:hypothetical protein
MADLQVNAAATGNGATMPVLGSSTVSFQVSGTFSATVTFEGTVDEATWVILPAVNVATGAVAATATAAGVYQADCAAFGHVRARVSAYVSGSVTVVALATMGEGVVSKGQQTAANSQSVVLASGTPVTGERQGSTSAVQLPNVAGSLVRIVARSDNAGSVYVGSSGVTKPDGTTDTTSGLELTAGQDTGWMPLTNLNVLYMICDNAGDDLTYMVLA